MAGPTTAVRTNGKAEATAQSQSEEQVQEELLLNLDSEKHFYMYF